MYQKQVNVIYIINTIYLCLMIASCSCMYVADMEQSVLKWVVTDCTDDVSSSDWDNFLSEFISPGML